MSYEVKLSVYEGPLDLLLHLIKRLEIDIYDIPMKELTSQYVEHIETMSILQLDELGEYLVLAATLIEIKSKMLLPVHEELEEVAEEEEDPRESLVERLLRYEQYKKAALQLEASYEEERQHFAKLPTVMEAVEEEETFNVFDLVTAFQNMLKKQVKQEPKKARVGRSSVTVEEAVAHVLAKLERHDGACRFDELFETYDRSQLVMTFFAILHLMRDRQVRATQQRNFDEVYIEKR
ncbi:segregation/condensation protein A [Savagea sp. SN6]|uniref:Segregation and condensation protein A n=1 Tax=Savagea serpentis TaxID=2785297 RepID=A0A8J7GHX9_9BACL|nr:segregation/condensation protein A [Savagea serpentis]MBF4500045.1 segregation/condensation protein A [Savagea serpentis]